MAAAPPALEFRSKEEFRALCHHIAMRMHFLNRTALGEQNFAWHVADALSALGQVFETHLDDADTAALFGDGWTPGTLSREESAAYLLGLIRDVGAGGR